ncbi:UNVERIFIED_CONTAM: hypothetical protein HDU68_002168 [Siphonaria sp. JEL0065]|nr:hypothetical protein HDU68_002168 [Siphonaria sp. JEL0065]
MISARSNDSKAKMLRFFGEQSIPVQCGRGSSSKVAKFFGRTTTVSTYANESTATPVAANNNNSTITTQLSFTSSDSVSSRSTEDASPTTSAVPISRALSTVDTITTQTAGSIMNSVEIPRASSSYMRPRTLPFRLVHQSRSDLGGSMTSGATVVASGVNGSGRLSAHGNNELYESSVSTNSLPRIPSTNSMSEEPTDELNQERISELIYRPLPTLSVNKSVGKLTQVLGPDVKLDVSIKEIAEHENLHEGLMQLIESRLPLCYFLLFLILEGRGGVDAAVDELVSLFHLM